MGLTKEQKKAKKEAKRLEKLKAEAEIQKQAKRNELQREINAQSRKKDELDKTWREMMLRIKEPVFKQDIEVMWHTFERAYDKKDNLINHTMKLIDVADDQFQRTMASFCVTLDTMINNFLIELEKLSKENDVRTAELLQSGEDEMAKILTDQNAAETHLQLLLYHGHTTADSLAWATRGEHLVKEDEEMIKYTNERENLRSFLENNYNSMWDEYKAILKSYIIETADNQKQVRKLRRKENLMADIIASQAKKIASSDGVLRRLRTELAAYEFGTKQAVFRDRRNRHRDAFLRLKKALDDGCSADAKLLNTLVRHTDDSLNWLESAHKKGEKILTLAALCRRFETQREKVLPYGCTIPAPPAELNTGSRSQQSEDLLVLNAMASSSGLTRLWQKVAKADLTKRALLHEKSLLEQENSMILKSIQSYEGKELAPNAYKCICTSEDKKPISKPVAIDGTIEIRKYLNNLTEYGRNNDAFK